jgi:hypothetical protein
MSSFTLPNTPFPEGTSVSAYDARGYASFPAGGPPGSPVVTATVTGGSLTFTGLTDHVPYFAAAKVAEAWQSKRFTPGEDGPPPEEALEAVDICAEFGVSTTVTDNSVPINEALEVLSPLGLRAVIARPGAYSITNPLVIGNGSSAEELTATRAGIVEGVGQPGWLDQFVSSARVQLTWNGAAGGNMVEVLGPVGGWGLKRLLLHGKGKAASPLRVTAGQFGQVEDLYSVETRTGIICRSSAAFKSIITNTMHNTWRRVGVQFNGFPESEKSTRNAGILLTSEGRTDANCSFEDWEHIWIAVPKSSVGNKLSAIHIGGSDSAWFRNIHPLYTAGGSDSQYSITFDYEDGNSSWPESSLIDGINIQKNPRNIGEPPVLANTAPNIITNISGANSGVTSDPKLPNLTWHNPRKPNIKPASEATAKEVAEAMYELGLVE